MLTNGIFYENTIIYNFRNVTRTALFYISLQISLISDLVEVRSGFSCLFLLSVVLVGVYAENLASYKCEWKRKKYFNILFR